MNGHSTVGIRARDQIVFNQQERRYEDMAGNDLCADTFEEAILNLLVPHIKRVMLALHQRTTLGSEAVEDAIQSGIIAVWNALDAGKTDNTISWYTDRAFMYGQSALRNEGRHTASEVDSTDEGVTYWLSHASAMETQLVDNVTIREWLSTLPPLHRTVLHGICMGYLQYQIAANLIGFHSSKVSKIMAECRVLYADQLAALLELTDRPATDDGILVL